MPMYNGFGLENLQRIQHLGSQAIEPDKHQAIEIADGHPFRRSTTQHIELVTKDKDFGLQCRPQPV
jgi:hypothetical protein